MTSQLVGLKVVVSIEEGMPEDLIAVNGTIIKPLNGPDGNLYWLVRLDHPDAGKLGYLPSVSG